MSIKYITNLKEGNAFKTLSKSDFIARLNNSLPTYEFTGNNDTKCKLYFDIDSYVETEYFSLETIDGVKNYAIHLIKENLKEYISVEPKISIATSNGKLIEEGKSKYSVRLYISNVYTNKSNIKSFVIKMNKKVSNEIWDYIEKPTDGKLFDESVYDNNRKMRCVNTSKDGENRPLIVEECITEDTVITEFFDENAVELPLIAPSSPTSVVEIDELELTQDEENLDDVNYMLQVCIKDKMCSTNHHKEWIIIGQILKNELKEQSAAPFISWTSKFASSNKKDECYEKITKYIKYTPLKEKNRLNFKSLHYYAKLHNKSKYDLRFNKKIEFEFDESIEKCIFESGDNTYAQYFIEKYGKNFKCINIKEKNIYQFTNNNLWDNNFSSGSKIREIISNEMRQNFIDYQNKLSIIHNTLNKDTDDSDLYQRKIKTISEIATRLNKTNDKNNILREIMDKIEDVEFEKDMNKEINMLPIKPCKMLNMETLEVTDRTFANKFNYECDAEFLEIMTEEQEQNVKQYFMDLFCQKEDMVLCVLDILKSILTGKTLRYIYFFTGSGMNGKSLLFKILKSIFKKSMDTIDTNVIIDQKISSQLTTQFEKLDKCRIGYVTELKEEMKLNESIIKKISGGDEIDFRGLFKSNITIMPTCNLCVLTNELPTFKVEKAIVDRIVNIPFNNVFEVDSNFETKMLNMKNEIFTYIMKYGTIRDKFDLTEDMIASKSQFINDNIKIDYLKDFIDNTFEIVPFEKKEKILRDTFRDSYNSYLKNKNQPIDKSSHQKFTRLIKSYGIDIQESHGKTYYKNIILRQFEEDDE